MIKVKHHFISFQLKKIEISWSEDFRVQLKTEKNLLQSWKAKKLKLIFWPLVKKIPTFGGFSETPFTGYFVKIET